LKFDFSKVYARVALQIVRIEDNNTKLGKNLVFIIPQYYISRKDACLPAGRQRAQRTPN
jgi:hypothetical protein